MKREGELELVRGEIKGLRVFVDAPLETELLDGV